ncbi:MAG TPA: hypothetical protein PLC65_06725 [Bacteroidia bacterium]|nr:hypothetical protein [Bacteroidia bacterium]HRD38308.1 hypothetical protein [Bacteroidia bacterium]
MKRSLKIILFFSLILNLVLIGIQVFYKAVYRVRETEPKDININVARSAFMDSLIKLNPELKDKKYFYINIWDTGCLSCIQQMPMLDSIVEPVKDNFGYVFITLMPEGYSKRCLNKEGIKTKNFKYMYNCQDFVFSIYKEKNYKRELLRAYKFPLNVIIDRYANLIYVDSLKALSGPKFPEDSLADKRFKFRLKTVLNQL